ncbi:hypothetical protein BJD12_12785 [Xanthomonas vesicatoria ATCC 35937]|uniref:Uncharacterized protein n=1 Tax=Xanthomonas vesicatoria TaxID=56460 RepID=A0AAJ0IVI9_9XANT|nr:hypothetical protein BI313_15760 [Xanthomonas vesicatoria]APP75963.1 hypothetical protein BJD12_12785 [Xanthomonas vesicatoria ATCC 35937]KHM91555.1 hypothetical protein OR61_18820 [Xanthomonas vesicatoria]KHM96630.1 hypothetical protein OR60_05215 [Xanthomonas vesicatoria]KTF34837.1 hypothetical protein LMG920_04715 [Xanthomonas vesicatoria]
MQGWRRARRLVVPNTRCLPLLALSGTQVAVQAWRTAGSALRAIEKRSRTGKPVSTLARTCCG